MSSRAQILRRKAGNEKALLISPGSTVRQLYEPERRLSPGWLNLWQIDGPYVGSMSSQERKRRRRFPLILPILLTACIPSQGLLDFPTIRAESTRQCGKPGAKATSCRSLLLPWPAPSTGLPAVGSSWAVTKIMASATHPPYIWLSSLSFLPPGPKPLLFYPLARIALKNRVMCIM